MSCNVMEEYIKLVRKQIAQYARVFFENKFNSKICNEYIEVYVCNRYYNITEGQNHSTLKNEILDAIKVKEEKLLEINDKDREKIIKEMSRFFYYVIYLDDIKYKEIDKLVDNIYQERLNIYAKEQSNFKEKMINEILEKQEDRKNFLKRFESTEFSIRLSNYQENCNAQKVILKQNIEFSDVYKNSAIEKAFNTGIIREDKLFVTYHLVVIQVINDMIKGNYRKNYIVDFEPTLINKKQKKERLLSIINNCIIQDKVYLQINYSIFIKNKQKVYELIQKGFKFAVILDDEFNSTLEEIETLTIFNYILIGNEIKTNEIAKNEKISQKTIKLSRGNYGDLYQIFIRIFITIFLWNITYNKRNKRWFYTNFQYRSI